MFSQLKSMVASAVTQDPIYEYSVDDESMVLCGRNEIFRVKSAVEVSSGKQVSIFQVKVADLMARQDPAADTTFFLDRVRRHVTVLAQLRHPGVLRIERGVVEVPGKKLWFVTERVKAWVPHLPLNEIPRQLRVLGLRRCAETLRFVHETADMMLVDFSPQALFVTADGRWKLGDFVHAIRRTEMMAESDAGVVSVLCPPSGSLRSVGAPLLDYVAAEFVDYLAKDSRVAAPGGGRAGQQPTPAHAKGPSLADLMGSGGNGGGGAGPHSGGQNVNLSAPLGFPDSDVYSFLLTTVEILNGGKKLFTCAGYLERHALLRSSVGREVEKYFPPGALTRRPRPPMSTVMGTGAFATPDMQLLDQIEKYDTLDPSERFGLLKALYTSLSPASSSAGSSMGAGGPNDFSLADFTKGKQAGKGGDGGEGGFCEEVIIENVLPLMGRESKQPSRLRFTLPIMLQCCHVLSPKAFEEHMREYFTALISAMLNAKPPWYEKVGLLAQLTLEKFDILCRQMSTAADRTQVLMPFLVKCLHTDANGDDEVLLALALNAMRRLFESGGDAAIAAFLPTNDSAAALAGKLTDIGASQPTLFTSAFQCLEKILLVASMSTKEATETHLIKALKQRSSTSSSSSDSATGAGGVNAFADMSSMPPAGISHETRHMQLQSMVSTLQRLEDGFSREHAAAKSIPQLSQLLLSTDSAVRAFAVQCIDKHLSQFRAASDGMGRPVASGGAFAAPTATPSSRTTASQPPRRLPATGTATDPSTDTVADLLFAPRGSSTTTAATAFASAPTHHASDADGQHSGYAVTPPPSSFSAASTHTNYFQPPLSQSGAAPAWSPAAPSTAPYASYNSSNSAAGFPSHGGGTAQPQQDVDIFASLGLS